MKSEKVSFVYRYSPYKKNKIYGDGDGDRDKVESVEQLDNSSVSVDKHVDNECDSYISNDNDSVKYSLCVIFGSV